MMAENIKTDSADLHDSPRTTLPPNYQLVNSENGRSYQILSVLGSGGFGVTYEAVSPEGKRVAIKEFFPIGITARNANYAITVIGDEQTAKERLQSFFKEATVLSSLQGLPSVVEIYEIFYANHTAYYVMEYIDGITMLHYLRKYGLMQPDAWNPRFRQLMEAIEILHNHNVIHRDISPDNIMIRNDGSFKLIDFGSARMFNGQQNLTINLKRNFAPLEQYSESGQGRYTDVYSLAATMYYAYTGKLVPLSRSKNDTDDEISQALRNAGVSTQQVEAILKALQVRAANRYQTMKEFETAYFGVQKPEPVGGNPAQKKRDSGIRASLLAIRNDPGYAIGAAICFMLALVLQLLSTG